MLHSVFWQNLGPKMGGRPSGELADAIEEGFGGFETFHKQLTEVAATVMGSGWAALVWEPVGKRLLTTQIYDHQSNLSQAGIPLLVLDVWEHAFYLQYQNRKAQYLEAIWKVWNWSDVEDRFRTATTVDVQLVGAAH